MGKFEGILNDIARVTNEEVAEKLARRLGGQEVFFSPNCTIKGKVAKIVGVEAARLIGEELGFGKRRVPSGNFRGRGARKISGIKLLQSGMAVTRVAELCDVNIITATRWAQEIKPLPKKPFKKALTIQFVA